MPVTLSSPGVYLDEINSLSLSVIASPTAVPLFAFGPFMPWKFDITGFEATYATATKAPLPTGKTGDAAEGKKPLNDTSADIIKKFLLMVQPGNTHQTDQDIESARTLLHYLSGQLKEAPASIVDPKDVRFFFVSCWKDYCTSIAPYLSLGRAALTHSITINANKLDTTGFKKNVAAYSDLLNGVGYYAMQHYFLNGGGPCHVALSIKGTAESIGSSLNDYAAQHADITLFCPLMLHPDVNDALLNSIMQSSASRLFCLTAAQHADPAPIVTKPMRSTQAAAYYPWLQMEVAPLFGLEPTDFLFATLPADNKLKTTFTNVEHLSNDLKKTFLAVISDLPEQHSKVTLSPVSAVAGAYCRTDAQRGVWKAPANVALTGVSGLCDQNGGPAYVTDTLNTALMKADINAIRFFTGEGYLIWGARTLAGQSTTDWRYVPVRRLFNSAERDIRRAMHNAIFEPNTPATWEIVRAAIAGYLHSLWQQGALTGDKPEEAFFVRIGLNITMSPSDIENGQMLLQVGMAAVRPAEFIVLEFSQKQME